MRVTHRQRLFVGGAKVAVALVLVSSAVGAAATPTAHRVAKHPGAQHPRVVSLVGTAAADVLRGGSGNDWIRGRGGVDRLFGGEGNDAIDAVDGARDAVSCGPGYDQVTADRADEVARDCEAVIRRDS
jgi:hypothetical protein